MAITEDSLPANGIMLERVVHWSLNGEAQPPFLCTPDALDDLAAGYLLSTGMVASYRQILEITLSDKKLIVLAAGRPALRQHIDERLNLLAPLESSLSIALETLRQCEDRLTGKESFFGTHRIMLYGPKGEIVREDIGRHNAADKVIGAAARLKWDFTQCAMGATGRISLEILAKAAVLGIPVLFSKKYPSDLCCDYAARLGIAIAAKIQSAGPELSGAVWRFAPDVLH